GAGLAAGPGAAVARGQAASQGALGAAKSAPKSAIEEKFDDKEQRAPEMKQMARVAAAAPPAQDAGWLETQAQTQRHAGSFATAAVMYRKAASLRQSQNDAGTAAWDLAQAVECLSSAGQ